MSAPRFTRPALWSDVVDLARRLNRHGVRYLLGGGYALAAHGLLRDALARLSLPPATDS